MKILKNFVIKKCQSSKRRTGGVGGGGERQGRIYLAFIVYATLVVDNILLTVVGKHFLRSERNDAPDCIMEAVDLTIFHRTEEIFQNSEKMSHLIMNMLSTVHLLVYNCSAHHPAFSGATLTAGRNIRQW